MSNLSFANFKIPSIKKPDKKMILVILIIICGVSMLAFIIETSLSSKKHMLTNQPNAINQSSQPQTQARAPLPQINTVTLTRNGFSPEKISIHKGTAVKWVNDSGTDNASVNSDDYPTNQRFPELNLGKINTGSAVAHIFQTAGTFTYHNEFNPKQTGTIVVE